MGKAREENGEEGRMEKNGEEGIMGRREGREWGGDGCGAG